MQTTLDRPAAPTLPQPEPAQDTDTLIVDVTWDDIRNGSRRDPYKCAIALAAQRQLDPACFYGMGSTLDEAHYDTSGFLVQWDRYESAAARIWMLDLDADLPVQPARFVFRRV